MSEITKEKGQVKVNTPRITLKRAVFSDTKETIEHLQKSINYLEKSDLGNEIIETANELSIKFGNADLHSKLDHLNYSNNVRFKTKGSTKLFEVGNLIKANNVYLHAKDELGIDAKSFLVEREVPVNEGNGVYDNYEEIPVKDKLDIINDVVWTEGTNEKFSLKSISPYAVIGWAIFLVILVAIVWVALWITPPVINIFLTEGHELSKVDFSWWWILEIVIIVLTIPLAFLSRHYWRQLLARKLVEFDIRAGAIAIIFYEYLIIIEEGKEVITAAMKVGAEVETKNEASLIKNYFEEEFRVAKQSATAHRLHGDI